MRSTTIVDLAQRLADSEYHLRRAVRDLLRSVVRRGEYGCPVTRLLRDLEERRDEWARGVVGRILREEEQALALEKAAREERTRAAIS